MTGLQLEVRRQGNNGHRIRPSWRKEKRRKASGKTTPGKDKAHDLDFRKAGENVYLYFLKISYTLNLRLFFLFNRIVSHFNVVQFLNLANHVVIPKAVYSLR